MYKQDMIEWTHTCQQIQSNLTIASVIKSSTNNNNTIFNLYSVRNPQQIAHLT